MSADKLVDSTRLDNALEYTAQRIRVKSGSSDSINFDLTNEKGFGNAIDAIPTGGGSSEVEYKDVNFYGLNAKLLYSYTLAEAQALTSLPTLPTDDVNGVPMTYDWVVTLNTINSLTSSNIPYNVCVAACPTDGKTHLHIELKEGRLSPYLGINTNGKVKIDWGDGSTNDTVSNQNKSVKHEYASAGKYEITLEVSQFFASYFYMDISGNSLTYSNFLWNNISSSTASYNYNQMYQNALKAIEIGNNVKISSVAFGACYSLNSITIPSSVTSIDGSAFASCRSIKSITIPSSATEIGSYIFNSCYSLTSIAIPSSISSIEQKMFSGCYSLESINIPRSITSIGNYAFSNCSSLDSINILNVTSFGTDMFTTCESLSSIQIPNGITSIPSAMFSSCYSLTSITIPSSVTSIGNYALRYCYWLAFIKFESSTPPMVSNSSTFKDIAKDCKILVPQGSLSAYTSASNYPSSSSYTYVEY